MNEIRQANFNSSVLEAKKPVVVHFWAEWCGPCRLMIPVIKDLSNEIEDVKFFKLNVDNESNLAAQYSILNIPTMILFKDGKELRRWVGAMNKEEFGRQLQKELTK